MSAGEIAFLALGALLGGIIAGLLIAFVRSRTAVRPSVRMTVASRSAAVTSASTFSGPIGPATLPAQGGPADLSAFPVPDADAAPLQAKPADSDSSAPVIETHVLNGDRVGVPVRPEEDLDFGSLIGREMSTVATATTTPERSGKTEGSPATVAVAQVAPRQPASADAAGTAGADVAIDLPSADDSAETEPAQTAEPADDRAATATNGSLEEHRQAVRERCAVADRLKATAVAAADVLRSEQRAYDVCLEQIRREETAVDGRAIRTAKDAAQLDFRRARIGAQTHADVEEAARRWLATIDSVNHAARVAAMQLAKDRQAASRLTARLERLSLEADAARIAAESAAEACLVARQRLATAEQGVAAEEEPARRTEVLIPLDPAAPMPRIVRLLRGDHGALLDVVAHLAGEDTEEQRRWQLQLAALVDGVVARALETAWLEFPADHPFWGMFSTQQDRDIANSLASLGFRFDGLGGFVDGRVPGQRELSLAVGYAGLDPMRIRRWPDQQGLEGLYRDVRVEAAEYLEAEAPSLTLGQLVTMLGRRAEQLTDLWNNWGRVRPLLLTP